MKFILLRRFTLLPLLSMALFTLLCIGSLVVQSSAPALAASRSSALSTAHAIGQHPHIPNGGTLNCSYMDPTLQLFYSSPAVVNGIIYVGSTDDYVYALKPNCTVLWSYLTGGPVYSSPTVVNGKVYIGSDDTYVYALNSITGAFIWKYQTGNAVRSAAAKRGNVVYIGSNDDKVYALNATTGAFIWSFTTGGAVTSTPRLSANGHRLYIGSGDDKVYALRTSNGTQVWSYTTGNAISRSSAALANVGGATAVFIGSTDNKLYKLNAATGAFMCSFTAVGPVESSPTIATISGTPTVFVGSDGSSYLSNDGALYSVNPINCTQNWNYVPPAGPSRNWVYDNPTVATISGTPTVYFGSLDHSIFALNAANGAFIWTYVTGNYVDSSPTVVNGLLYIGSNDGYLYELTA